MKVVLTNGGLFFFFFFIIDFNIDMTADDKVVRKFTFYRSWSFRYSYSN